MHRLRARALFNAGGVWRDEAQRIFAAPTRNVKGVSPRISPQGSHVGRAEISPKRVANNLPFVLGIARYPASPAGARTAVASRIIRYHDCSR
jgi:hypothetical protein